ncbi:MAG: hypothetical protein P9L89_04390 [Candidatus Celaenobacter polaris]|nr:hypothetical protein [Candidatus Celaenobacter polaris]
MDEFKFSQDLSPEENIELFFILLGMFDEEMTTLLKDNIDKILPLPSSLQRTNARISFNEAIMKGLEDL